MIIQWGTEEQQQRWLPGHPLGRRALVPGLQRARGRLRPRQHAHASRSATATTTSSTARRPGSRPRTSREWGLFLLRTDPTAIERGAKHEGITAFIVDMETPGIECRPIRDITGDTMLNEVFFTDARIPVDCRLGGEGEGWQVAMSTLGHERVGTAGLVDHDGGRPAGDDLAGARGEPRRAATTRSSASASPGCSPRSSSPGCSTTGRSPRSSRASRTGPRCRSRSCSGRQIAQTLAELAVDLLGPAGLLAKGGPDAVDGGTWTRNYSWQRYTSIGAGATEIQKNIIAKKAIKLPRK